MKGAYFAWSRRAGKTAALRQMEELGLIEKTPDGRFYRDGPVARLMDEMQGGES